MLEIKKNLRGFTQHQSFGAGFTLIEIIIVVAIISIMAGLVITSLGVSRAKKELETNAREFVGVVREAQNYALTGKQVVAGTAPCSFMVNWGGSGYTLTYKYKNASGVCNQTLPIVTYALKNGVSFSGGNDNVTFDVPHAVLNFSGIKSVTFTKSSSNHKVCIYADGRISDWPGTTTCP